MICSCVKSIIGILNGVIPELFVNIATIGLAYPTSSEGAVWLSKVETMFISSISHLNFASTEKATSKGEGESLALIAMSKITFASLSEIFLIVLLCLIFISHLPPDDSVKKY